MSTRMQITFDAGDPRTLGAFWGEALGYEQQPAPDGFADWEAAMTAWGLPPERFGDYYALVDPDEVGPRIWFQRVPEPKTAKNRVHLDVNVGAGAPDAGERVARIRGHARRLVSCGGTVQREVEENGEYWIVMLDPEGNEFCLQ
jgi:hypothetical protein